MPTTKMHDGHTPHILIVDSHAADRERLKAQLSAMPFKVAVAANSREAQKRIATMHIDAVVVDPDLPDEDGFSLVRLLSAAPDRLVFVIADGEDEHLPDHAYANGATDFAYKPIGRNDLVCRLRKKIEEQPRDRPPRVSLNRVERRCSVDGREYALTRNERSFLACLLDSPRNFATYRELICAVWGENASVETQSLRVLAAQVRRKLENGESRSLIHTVVGEGFKLDL